MIAITGLFFNVKQIYSFKYLKYNQIRNKKIKFKKILYRSSCSEQEVYQISSKFELFSQIKQNFDIGKSATEYNVSWQHCLLRARPYFISLHSKCTAVRNLVGRSTKVFDLARAEKDVILAITAYCPTFEDGVRLLS